MTVLRQRVDIPAPPAVVYDYVTRPLRWQEWHASSLGVQGVADESLVAGRRFEEDVSTAGGLRRHLTWLVEDSRPAQHWRASAYMPDGSTVRLHYAFTATATGTRFERTLDYVIASRFLRVIDGLWLSRRIQHESEAALEKLRQHFEGRR